MKIVTKQIQFHSFPLQSCKSCCNSLLAVIQYTHTKNLTDLSERRMNMLEFLKMTMNQIPYPFMLFTAVAAAGIAAAFIREHLSRKQEPVTAPVKQLVPLDELYNE